MKRIFVFGKIYDRLPNTAFRWNIFTDLNRDRTMGATSLWISDKADIFVNLISAPLNRFTSHKQLYTTKRALKQLGVEKLIKYVIDRDPMFVHHGEQLAINYEYRTADYEGGGGGGAIRVFNVKNISELRPGFINIRKLGDDNSSPHLPMDAHEFITAFAEQKSVVSVSPYVCQMCLRGVAGRMYAFCKSSDQSPLADRSLYAAICYKCLCSGNILGDHVNAMAVRIISFENNRRFSDVCESHGIPKPHALLVESLRAKEAKHGYIRDETRIAFETNVTNIHMICGIVKFMQEVPNGEFILFGSG